MDYSRGIFRSKVRAMDSSNYERTPSLIAAQRTMALLATGFGVLSFFHCLFPLTHTHTHTRGGPGGNDVLSKEYLCSECS